MSKNWTKGPWGAGRYGGSKEDNWFVRSADGQKVAGRGGPPISEAHAKLFAASPDLYDALEETLAIAERNEQGGFAVRARAALAKARGES